MNKGESAQHVYQPKNDNLVIKSDSSLKSTTDTLLEAKL